MPQLLTGSAHDSQPLPQTMTATNGLTSGTTLLTLDGAIPVDWVNAGDRVISRNSGTARLLRIDVEPTSGPFIKIAAGALGQDRPEGPLFLPPQQRILLREGATTHARTGLVPAHELVNDTTITWHHPSGTLRLMSLFFETPQIIYAGGVELESAA